MENAGKPIAHRKVVLVVDDESIIRMVAADFVGDAGMTAIEASGAEQALAILERRDDVCLVLTDIQMPGSMDGLQFASIVGERWPQMPIIITSGRIRPSASEMPPHATFLSKPYFEESMVPALKKAAAGC